MVTRDIEQLGVDRELEHKPTDVSNFERIEEVKGSLEFTDTEDKLMHSVLESDKKTIDEGKLIRDAINQGMSAFTPDAMFENLVKNYSLAKQIYGESLIRQLLGYEPDYVEKNIGIPEFQKLVKEQLDKKIKELKQENFLDRQGVITNKGIELASLIMYVQELDHIIPKGIHGKRVHKKHFIYGDKENTKQFKKDDRYRDIAIKKSVKTAIRRGHKKLEKEDLRSFEKQSKGECYIIYALDASGSMRGQKVSTCKRAGVALCYKAIQNKDKVGLIVFGSEVKTTVAPTRDFTRLLKTITSIRATAETDLAGTIKKAITEFPNLDVTKHLLLLTDMIPTKGKQPKEETLKAASIARTNGITISVVGIKLDKEGKQLAEKIAKIGNGRIYIIKDLEQVDKIVLEDYYAVM